MVASRQQPWKRPCPKGLSPVLETVTVTQINLGMPLLAHGQNVFLDQSQNSQSYILQGKKHCFFLGTEFHCKNHLSIPGEI